jgi:thiol-disulfide isomerase/thioredoxin
MIKNILRHCAVFAGFLMLSLVAQTNQAEQMMLKVTIAVEGMMKSKSGATWMSWPNSVVAALSEQQGIKNIEVDLSVDEFTVSYNPDEIGTEQMFEAINETGFTPSIVRSRVAPSFIEKKSKELPSIIQMALDKANADGKQVFIDFYADWCGACLIMDRTTFKDKRVLSELDTGYVFVKVDTDKHPEVGKYFDVVGLPTIMKLEASGNVVYRHTGPLEAEPLLNVLKNL